MGSSMPENPWLNIIGIMDWMEETEHGNSWFQQIMETVATAAKVSLNREGAQDNGWVYGAGLRLSRLKLS